MLIGFTENYQTGYTENYETTMKLTVVSVFSANFYPEFWVPIYNMNQIFQNVFLSKKVHVIHI